MTEQLERRVATAAIMATIRASSIAASGEDPSGVEIPNPDEYRAEFDMWLVHEPKSEAPKDVERRELMQALGLGTR